MRQNVIVGAGGCLLLCLLLAGSLFLGRELFLGWAMREPGDVTVQLTAPAQVVANEPFVVTLTIENSAPAQKTLYSVDIAASYLDGFTLGSTTPAFVRQTAVPLAGYQSYLFDRTVPGRGRTTIELALTAARTGTFAGVIDVCVDNATLCKATAVRTEVLAGE